MLSLFVVTFQHFHAWHRRGEKHTYRHRPLESLLFQTATIRADVLVVLFVLGVSLFYGSVRFSGRIIRDHTGVYFFSTFVL